MIDALTSTMHDHTLWASEVGVWRDELRAWQEELGKAQVELIQLEKPFQDHAHTLRTHGSALRLYEQEFFGHEPALTEFERRGVGNGVGQLEHRQEADHQAQQQTHEQLKRHHQIVMTHFRSLLKALRQPLEVPKVQPMSEAPLSSIVRLHHAPASKLS
jgi:hypothetical protein